MKSIALNTYKDDFLDFKKNKETGGQKKEEKERREGKIVTFPWFYQSYAALSHSVESESLWL